MPKYEYKIVGSQGSDSGYNQLGDIESKINDLAQAGYRLASFTDITYAHNDGGFVAVMERQLANKGDAARIRRYLCQQVQLARRKGDKTITFRSGDVHDALGLVNRLPNVCQVLNGAKFHEAAVVEILRYLERPPSGQGANLVIEFRIL